jgi:hypothetical protein
VKISEHPVQLVKMDRGPAAWATMRMTSASPQPKQEV